MTATPGIDPSVPPSGPGCVECEKEGGWWFHLRRCAQCGHIGCCDSSPSQHARGHARAAGHPVVRSYEPGEDWFWDFSRDEYARGPELAPRPRTRSASPRPVRWVEYRRTGGSSCTDRRGAISGSAS